MQVVAPFKNVVNLIGQCCACVLPRPRRQTVVNIQDSLQISSSPYPESPARELLVGT